MPHGVSLATPRRRRPAGKTLDSITSGGSTTAGQEPPKIAWWRDLFSWDIGPHQKRQGPSQNLTGRPRGESDHLQWARQVKSVRCEWVREQRSTQLGPRTKSRCDSAPTASASSTSGPTARSQELKPCKSKYGAALCIPLESDAQNWVQALRASDSIDSLAATWQETKSRKLRRAHALGRLKVAQVKWRQDEAEKDRLRSTSESTKIDKEDEREEDEWYDAGSLHAPDGGVSQIPISDSDQQGVARSRLSSKSSHSINGESDGQRSPSKQKTTWARIKEWSKSRGNSRTASERSSPSSSPLGSPRGAQSDRGSVSSSHSLQFADASLREPQPDITSSTSSRRQSCRLSRRQSRHSPLASGRATPEVHYDEDPGAATILEEAEEHDTEGRKEQWKKRAKVLKKRTFLAAGSFEKQAPPGVMELSEEWRTEFSMETLDGLTDYLESYPVEHGEENETTRTIPLADFSQAMAKLLGYPEEITCKQCVDSDLLTSTVDYLTLKTAGLLGYFLTFSSMSEFLSLACKIAQATDKEFTKQQWSGEGLRALTESFNRHASCQGRLPMVIFFQVVKQLGVAELQLEDVESQKWMAEVTKTILEGRRIPKSERGTISFDDFCRIITTALREKERQNRRISVQKERAALEECGFSILEMEDLRELYQTYSRFELPLEKAASYLEDPLLRMTMLLHGCAVGKLSHDDAAKLKAIVRNTPGYHRCVGDGIAPFDLFMLWMKQVLYQGLTGNIDWTLTDPSLSEHDLLLNRSGFAAAMLRESAREQDYYDYCQRKCEHDGRDGNYDGASQEQSHNPDDVTGHQRAGITSTRKRSSSSASPRASERQETGRRSSHARASLRPTSYLVPRHGSIGGGSQPNISRRNSAVGQAHGSAVNSPGSRHSLISRQKSASSGSRRSSKKKNDSPHHRVSLKTDKLQSSTTVGELGMTISKSLPPAQAMLNHRRFRACSVNLTDDPPVVPTAEEQSAQLSVSASLSAPLPRRLSLKYSSEIGDPIEIELPALLRGALFVDDVHDLVVTAKSTRKMKHASNPATILTDVISKLEEQAADHKLPSPPAVAVVKHGGLLASLEKAAADRGGNWGQAGAVSKDVGLAAAFEKAAADRWGQNDNSPSAANNSLCSPEKSPTSRWAEESEDSSSASRMGSPQHSARLPPVFTVAIE